MTQTLGQRLKERRLSMNLTRNDMEGLTKISMSSIQRIETGYIKRPSFADIVKLSDAMNISLAELSKYV